MMATKACSEKRKLSVCCATVMRAPLWEGLPMTKLSQTARWHRSQKMAQKDPEKKIPPSAANTRRSVVSCCSLFIHLMTQFWAIKWMNQEQQPELPVLLWPSLSSTDQTSWEYSVLTCKYSYVYFMSPADVRFGPLRLMDML
eukprot:642118-Rhodomonas_salina.4